jgi:hypothetical protein
MLFNNPQDPRTGTRGTDGPCCGLPQAQRCLDHALRWGSASVSSSVKIVTLNSLARSPQSDNPVTPIQPLQYVETAVTRVNYYDGKVLGPDQCVSVEEWV